MKCFEFTGFQLLQWVPVVILFLTVLSFIPLIIEPNNSILENSIIKTSVYSVEFYFTNLSCLAACIPLLFDLLWNFSSRMYFNFKNKWSRSEFIERLLFLRPFEDFLREWELRFLFLVTTGIPAFLVVIMPNSIAKVNMFACCLCSENIWMTWGILAYCAKKNFSYRNPKLLISLCLVYSIGQIGQNFDTFGLSDSTNHFGNKLNVVCSTVCMITYLVGLSLYLCRIYAPLFHVRFFLFLKKSYRCFFPCLRLNAPSTSSYFSMFSQQNFSPSPSASSIPNTTASPQTNSETKGTPGSSHDTLDDREQQLQFSDPDEISTINSSNNLIGDTKEQFCVIFLNVQFLVMGVIAQIADAVLKQHRVEDSKLPILILNRFLLMAACIIVTLFPVRVAQFETSQAEARLFEARADHSMQLNEIDETFLSKILIISEVYRIPVRDLKNILFGKVEMPRGPSLGSNILKSTTNLFSSSRGGGLVAPISGHTNEFDGSEEYEDLSQSDWGDDYSSSFDQQHQQNQKIQNTIQQQQHQLHPSSILYQHQQQSVSQQQQQQHSSSLPTLGLKSKPQSSVASLLVQQYQLQLQQQQQQQQQLNHQSHQPQSAPQLSPQFQQQYLQQLLKQQQYQLLQQQLLQQQQQQQQQQQSIPQRGFQVSQQQYQRYQQLLIQQQLLFQHQTQQQHHQQNQHQTHNMNNNNNDNNNRFQSQPNQKDSQDTPSSNQDQCIQEPVPSSQSNFDQSQSRTPQERIEILQETKEPHPISHSIPSRNTSKFNKNRSISLRKENLSEIHEEKEEEEEEELNETIMEGNQTTGTIQVDVDQVNSFHP